MRHHPGVHECASRGLVNPDKEQHFRLETISFEPWRMHPDRGYTLVSTSRTSAHWQFVVLLGTIVAHEVKHSSLPCPPETGDCVGVQWAVIANWCSTLPSLPKRRRVSVSADTPAADNAREPQKGYNETTVRSASTFPSIIPSFRQATENCFQ